MFLKKPTKTAEKKILSTANKTEQYAVKNCYCRTPLKNKKGVKFHYWKKNSNGKKTRANATYVFGKGWK